jgi:GNAT superfamily N-acetyltransferase
MSCPEDWRGSHSGERGGRFGYVLDVSWTLRAATEDDISFLTDMLVEAMNWRPEPEHRFSRQRVMTDPKLAHYVAGWPGPRDLGVVAESEGQPVGAVWLRFLPEDDAGFGFVAPEVPELTIGVVAAWRGRGVGRALLRAIAKEAGSAGIRRISLSVERENYAHRLYQDEGYRVVDSSDLASDTMVADL